MDSFIFTFNLNKNYYLRIILLLRFSFIWYFLLFLFLFTINLIRSLINFIWYIVWIFFIFNTIYNICFLLFLDSFKIWTFCKIKWILSKFYLILTHIRSQKCSLKLIISQVSKLIDTLWILWLNSVMLSDSDKIIFKNLISHFFFF